MIYNLSACAGSVQIETSGDGNNTKNIITLTEGQFPFAEVQKVDEGIQFVIYGEWEMNEMVDALVEHGYGWNVNYHPQEEYKPTLLQKVRGFFRRLRFLF